MPAPAQQVCLLPSCSSFPPALPRASSEPLIDCQCHSSKGGRRGAVLIAHGVPVFVARVRSSRVRAISLSSCSPNSLNKGSTTLGCPHHRPKKRGTPVRYAPAFPTNESRLHPTAARRLRQRSRTWLPLLTRPPPFARTPRSGPGTNSAFRGPLATRTTVVRTSCSYFNQFPGAIKSVAVIFSSASRQSSCNGGIMRFLLSPDVRLRGIRGFSPGGSGSQKRQ